MRYTRAYVRGDVTSDDPAAPVIWVASTPGVKSDGVDLRIKDWDLSRYNNPAGPVLWAHDYSGRWLPIGKGTARIEDAQLLINVEYDVDDDHAQRIRAKALKGMVQGSVGWDDVQVGNRKKHQLLEFSMVPVGVDPASRPLVQARAYRQALIDDIAAAILCEERAALSDLKLKLDIVLLKRDIRRLAGG